MAIIGFYETIFERGTINTAESFSAEHKFPAPGLKVWSRPYLQSFGVNSDEGSVSLWISRYVDKQGQHDGKFRPGIFAEGCTYIRFRMHTNDATAGAVLTTEIWE